MTLSLLYVAPGERFRQRRLYNRSVHGRWDLASYDTLLSGKQILSVRSIYDSKLILTIILSYFNPYHYRVEESPISWYAGRGNCSYPQQKEDYASVSPSKALI